MSTHPARHHLLGHELARLTGAVQLRVTRGTLWVTIDGQADDVLLEAGEGYVHDGRAAMIASALGGPASFTATPLAPRAAARWLTWLRPQHRVAPVASRA